LDARTVAQAQECFTATARETMFQQTVLPAR